MKKEMVKKNYILFGLLLVFVLGLIAGNILVRAGEAAPTQPPWDGNTASLEAFKSTPDKWPLPTSLNDKNRADFIKWTYTTPSWEALDSYLKIAVNDNNFPQFAKEFIGYTNKAGEYPSFSSLFKNPEPQRRLNPDSIRSLLTGLGKLDPKEKPESFKNFWNSFEDKKLLMDALNDDSFLSKKENQDLRNEFLSTVSSQIIKENKEKYGEKHPGIKYELGAAKVSYDKDKKVFFIGEGDKKTELTLNEWISSVKVDDKGVISGIYANQGFDAAKRTVVFPKGAQSLLDDKGNYNGVNVLYGIGGIVTITSTANGDTYSLANTGSEPAAIFVNGVIYTGNSFTVKNGEKGANLVGSAGAAEAWFNVNYGGTDKHIATSYGYLKLNDGEGVITNDVEKFKALPKGVLLNVEKGIVKGVLLKGVNGVDIVGGGDVSKLEIIKVASEGSSNVKIARFSNGQVQAVAGLVQYTFAEGIEGYVSPDLNVGSVGTGENGDMVTQDGEPEGQNPGQTNTGAVGGNFFANLGGAQGNAGTGNTGSGQSPQNVQTKVAGILSQYNNQLPESAYAQVNQLLGGKLPQGYSWASKEVTTGCQDSGGCRKEKIYSLQKTR